MSGDMIISWQIPGKSLKLFQDQRFLKANKKVNVVLLLTIRVFMKR